MGRGGGWTRLGRARAVAHATAVALLAGLLVSVTPTAALAAQTVLFNRPFTASIVGAGGTAGTVTVPTASGTNRACLTASGNTVIGPLLSCTGTSDAPGSGTLRLTAAGGSQVGGVFSAESVPATQGIEATFNTYQYGGSGADGMSFVLAAVDPTTQVPPSTTGPAGGSLGYSPGGGAVGLAYGYLGIGLDVYGSFSSPSFQGSGCATTTNMTARVPNAVAVRGPGNGRVGYCGLSTTYTGVAGSAVALRAATSTRPASMPVQVLINPGTTTFTATNGQAVAAGSYKVVVTPVGTATPRTLTGTLPTVAAGLYPEGYLTSGGVPRQLAFGLFASTGGQTDVHEVSNLKVSTFNAVAELGVTTTSYAASTPGAGGPVNYVITPTVSGVAVPGPVTVTQTVPTGVSIQGGFGSGWTCADPVGPKITCTTTGSSFAAGTTLPPINVVGIATSASVTSTNIRNGSPTTVSADDASGATSTTTTAGTRPTAPSGITLSPSKGALAGGDAVTISGAGITGATAVHVGTTAEQQAGTPVTLLPCSTVITTACFTVSGGNLVVSSWPARSTVASATVTVQTLGIAGTAGYTYASVPDTPAAPVASGGADRVDLSWTTPDSDGGSAITGYVITRYRDGATTGTNVTVGVRTSVGFTDVTPGASYTFTIAATNANGTSAPSALSNAVVPYTLPGAPAITGATAGTSSATLSWNAPASNGYSAITGYVVTPYVGGVAQAPQTFSGAGTTRTVTGLTAGTAYTFTVAAQNAAGTGAASAASTAVRPNASPGLAFPDPPAGEAGVAYSHQLAVTDGTSPFTWSVSAGSLPPGLTLNPSTGLLDGTPTAAGSYTFTVRVVDASGQSATRPVTLTLAAAPALTFSPAAGEVTVTYRQASSVSGGTGPFTWSVRSGALPAGVSLDPSTGVVSGTPTAAGSFPVTLAVQDSFGQSATRTATIVIAAVPSFTFTAPPTARVGVAYSTSLAVSGGTAPLTWSVTAGALPAGLALDVSTGVLSGTPTATGTTSFTVGVVDAFGVTASKATAITVNPGPVTITKTANVSSVAPGGTVSSTITVTNTGTGAFNGVTLSDPLGGVLDDATYNNDAAASSGTVGYTAPTLSWTGNLAAGATATITYSVTVANPVTGNQVLAGTVTSTTLGTTCPAGGTDPRCTSTVTVSGLSVVSSADVATTTPGSTVGFSVVVRNSGQTPYAPASLTQDLTGTLDDATYNADVTATLGTATVSGSTLSWSGSLAPGASATIRYTATVVDPDPGNRTLTSLVTSLAAGSVCPSGNPAASCRVSVRVLVPALSVTTSTATGPVVPGDRVPYTLTIANTGETPYTGAGVALDLAAVLDDAVLGTFTTTAGTLAFSPTTGVGTWTGDLALGATVTVSGFVTVRDPDPGDRVLTTAARSSAPGSSCPPGTTSTACATRVEVRVPQLTIAAATDVSSTTPGSTVRHTVTVTNTGQTDYTGAVFAAALAGVLDDATLDGSPSATRGTATYADGAVSWRGDLAVGASATVTWTTTVLDPDPGDRRLISAVTSTTAFASCPVGGTDPRCRSDVAVLLPSLALSTTADVASTTPGGVVRYTLTAANTGETTYRGTTITLERGGLLDDATTNVDAVASTGDLVRAADGALLWTLTLAPGASATTVLSVTVRKPDPGDRVLVTNLSAPVQGSSCQPGSSAAGCRLSVPVLLPRLEITKTADRATVLPGGSVGYTVTVANMGESVQDGAAVVDDLSGLLADVSYDGSATASTGTVRYAEPKLTWTGTLAPGASATFSYAVTVRDPDPGDKQLLSTIVSDAPGSNCAPSSTDAWCRVGGQRDGARAHDHPPRGPHHRCARRPGRPDRHGRQHRRGRLHRGDDPPHRSPGCSTTRR